jgi:hypothetical protein
MQIAEDKKTVEVSYNDEFKIKIVRNPLTEKYSFLITNEYDKVNFFIADEIVIGGITFVT